MDEHLSIDEQIIAYKGKKTSFRQHKPKKPKRWGFKIFVSSGRSGLNHKIDFYGQPVEELEINGVGKSGQVVLRLAEAIPNQMNHKLDLDNWFNLLATQVMLAQKGIQSVGTVQLNRAKNLSFDLRSPQRCLHCQDNHHREPTTLCDLMARQ